MTTALITAALLLLALTATAAARGPNVPTQIARATLATWTCQDQLGIPRTRQSVTPWKLPTSARYRRWVLNLWAKRKTTCLRDLHAVAQINRNLYRIGSCETGGKPGQNGVPDWDHRARSEHPGRYYEGALGFLDTTWDQFKPAGYPAGAHQATPGQQYVVGRILVRVYGGYSSWPACHRKLGLS